MKKAKAKKKTSVKPATVLVLRTCAKDLTAHGGFQWPKSGEVSCPDWNSGAHCGNGLHGLLWGEGDGSLLNWSEDAKWLVVEVEASKIVHIGTDKVKFPCGVVVHCGDRKSATEYILANGAIGKTVTGATISAGDGGTATAGDRGTATAGYGGTATAGYGGTATAGDGGVIIARWWDGNRYRILTGYVGEDGVEANRPYSIVDAKWKLNSEVEEQRKAAKDGAK